MCSELFAKDHLRPLFWKMSKNRKKEEQERDESASLASTITAPLTEKLAEHKAEPLAEIRDTYKKYETKFQAVWEAVEDHKQRISSLEQSLNPRKDSSNMCFWDSLLFSLAGSVLMQNITRTDAVKQTLFGVAFVLLFLCSVLSPWLVF